jgi:hypothetical protein
MDDQNIGQGVIVLKSLFPWLHFGLCFKSLNLGKTLLNRLSSHMKKGVEVLPAATPDRLLVSIH